jgi:hypothetical protein
MASGQPLSPQEAVERAREYLAGYLGRVEARGMQEKDAPLLYRNRPYEAHCLPLEGGGLLLLLRQARSESFKAAKRGELASRAYDASIYLVGAEATSQAAEARGAADADRDCSISLALANLEGARDDAHTMAEAAEELLKANPWLDGYANASIASSERLILAIDEHTASMRREIESLAALHRTALADLARSAPAPQASAPVDDLAISQLRSKMAELAEAHDGRWKKAAHDFDVLADVARRIDTIFDDLEALKLKVSRELDESSGSKKLKEGLSAAARRLDAIDAELAAMREDIKVSQEIRETLFRDSKRIHNINERLNALEGADEDGGIPDKLAEMTTRLDAMERRITTEITIAVQDALQSERATPPALKKDAKPTTEKRKR